MATCSQRLLKLAAACSLALGFLGPQTVQADADLNPARLAGPLIIRQNSQTVTIDYQQSTAQTSHTIYHAVWSDADGQDDLVWYRAGPSATSFSLAAHKGYGTYHVHTYIDINGQLTGLNISRFQAKEPAATTSVSTPETGFIEVRLTQIPNTISEILIPTWSDRQGQDDIRWYAAEKDSDGSYRLRIRLKDHHFDQGLYHVHAYGRQEKTGQLRSLSAQTLTIREANLPTAAEQQPVFAVTEQDQDKGTYRVSVQETDKSKSVKSVDLAVWSADGQRNLHWYSLEADGREGFAAQVDLRKHQALAGQYSNHVYVTYKDGTRSGYVLPAADFSQFHLPAVLSSTHLDSTSVSLSLQQVYSPGEIHFVVWSDVNGQDDIRWYKVPADSQGNFRKTLDLRQHKGSGLYHFHAYRKDGDRSVFLGGHTFQMTEPALTPGSSISPTVNHAGNLYPVGQCTWGVKGLAPWASNYWGNARDWYTNAQRQGFQVGTVPQAGAIAVWPNDGVYGGVTYGHVAYVTHVESASKIQVQESNYAGKTYIGNFRGWFNPQQIWQNGRYVSSPVYYIYPKVGGS